MRNLKLWHNRGYLPHFEAGEIPQFITFRLHDSLPQDVLERWRNELEGENSENSKIVLQSRIETYLDQGYGKCYLQKPETASSVQAALLFFDNERYRLLAWVIMPNHVHFLATPINDHQLSEIVHSIKSFTAKEINKLSNRQGILWQREYYDRYIRDGKHFDTVVSYIENNPVKARLCRQKQEWLYSSAYFQK